MDERSLNILYLAHRIPYPPDKGDKIRAYHVLSHLARRHRVWCACFVDDPADVRHIADLRRCCRDVIAVPLDRRRATLRALLHLARGRTATEGFYRVPAMGDRLRTLRRRVGFDVVLAYSSSMAQYANVIDAPRNVLDLCDLDSRKWDQMARRKRPPVSWLLAAEARRLAELETRLCRRFDATILIGAHEARGWSGADRSRLHFVGNGVTLPLAAEPAPPEPATVGFVGDMGYFPNEDAMVWFVRQVWPQVRRAVPAARFEIVGRNPSRAALRLGRVPGVRVVGCVPNVAEHLRRFAVVVAPLRIARGVQNKVLEALAAGKAVVASPQASAGIEIDHAVHAMIADGAAAFATQVTRLLDDRDLAARLGAAGRTLVRDRYAWDRRLEALEGILRAPASVRDSARLSPAAP